MKNRLRYDFTRIIVLLFADLLSFYISVFLAFSTRALLGELFGGFLTAFRQTLRTYTYFWGLPLLFILVLAYEGFYSERRYFWEDLKEFLKALVLYFFLIFTVLSLLRAINKFSRIVLILTHVFLAFVLPTFRYISNLLLYKLGIREKCVFVGSDKSFEDFKSLILKDRYLGFELGEQAPYAFVSTTVANVERVVGDLQRSHRYVYIFDDAGYYIPSQLKMILPIGREIPLLEFQNRLLDPKAMFGKRVLEIIFGLLILPVVLPIIFFFGILIKLDSDGPVFYMQERIGKDGKPFKCIKFRTMYRDADKRLKDILEADEKAREEWEKYFKLKEDPRVTKVGKFLRRTSLDELPQVFNVLKGDMSFIGPRPVVKKEIEQYYRDKAQYYYEVRPGITGLWQVSGRNELDYERRVRLDVWYVLNWSLWLDLIILLKTVKVVFSGKGAY
ncbi:MAG TPA: exopolysaccharide biosynthesis polyprenyl glycosylphosphotransferase [Candidatus Hydrothermia bacterium]|nr:exopolysaccharide biosynthesis polyprenyl glycosylphosphotransferase [Candidatus Hydrothermae bacterium]MDD3649585.1 exopolysaccharide biosynthesis polyprenyl glycosylphosphotransferase [Candidatus Hydrothermia bacterium]MDD5572759.1 exopolysaccharide biosynthesis polyprenyl glycosylphosphotransferase [Candidatus Hydrothermia bacterium]HOK23497.1 exopolysaccharide biosynthesis polyprenyl glycosylphosphotransferase [Candidatus Hydrothermia bacterium]HOL24039.1 exopolysaccharide biosynthesis p